MIRPLYLVAILAALGLGSASASAERSGSAPEASSAPEAKSGLAGILARGELRVGMSGEQPPLNMTTKSGELVGLEVALAQVLAQLIDVKPRFVRLPFAQLFDALESGQIDLAMSGIGITPARNLRAIFVGPYFVSGKSLLSKSRELLAAQSGGELNREDLRIAVLAGSTSEAYAKRNMPKAQLTSSSGLDAAVELVRTGQADALLADLETCHFAELRSPGSGLLARRKAFTVEPIGIALPPGDPQLENLLQNYLSALERDGALERARAYWFENDDWLDSLK